MLPNVFFIMVDALRADQLWGKERGCHTPFLDEFISKSTVFSEAFSTASMTTCCTASILTGSYPFVHGIRSLADHRLGPDIPTLAQIFQDNGYRTFAEVTGPLLPVTGMNRGFDDYNHREYSDWLDTSWGDSFLDKLRHGLPEPWFLFLHLWELHNPRRVLKEYDAPDFGRNMYERALSSLDRQLGRVLDVLPEDTVVILTGDHGEFISESQQVDVVSRLKKSFKVLKKYVPGVKKLKRLSPLIFRGVDRIRQNDNNFYFNWLGHGYHVYDYLTNVPLVFSGPKFFPENQVREQLVSHVDIFPTLVSVFDLVATNTAYLNGIDLMPAIRKETAHMDARYLYMEASGGRTTPLPDQWLAGIRTEKYKYVRGLYNPDIPEELYDLGDDPNEEDNLIGDLPGVADELRTYLAMLVEAGDRDPVNISAEYSESELDQLQGRLRDLGYMD